MATKCIDCGQTIEQPMLAAMSPSRRCRAYALAAYLDLPCFVLGVSFEKEGLTI